MSTSWLPRYWKIDIRFKDIPYNRKTLYVPSNEMHSGLIRFGESFPTLYHLQRERIWAPNSPKPAILGDFYYAWLSWSLTIDLILF